MMLIFKTIIHAFDKLLSKNPQLSS